MPVFNCGEWLAEAITSIRAQSFMNFELIIIDDGSADQSNSIIAAAMRDDDRIRMIWQDHLGITAALNRGLALSRAKIIARMDGDDIAAPDRLRVQLAFLDSRPEVGAVGSCAHVINDHGKKLKELRPETNPEALARLLPRQNPFVHSSMMFLADSVRSMGGYRTLLEGAEDYDLWLRIAERAQVANVAEFLVTYRRHSKSASAKTVHKRLLSARLARLSATARRGLRPDFIESLEMPLNLDALQDHAELRITAKCYGLLMGPTTARCEVKDLIILLRANINHAERKAAQLWLMDLLRNHKSYKLRVAALFLILVLHPPRGLSLVWSIFQSRISS